MALALTKRSTLPLASHWLTGVQVPLGPSGPTMQGTDSTGEKEDRVSHEPPAVSTQTFSELELKNRQFRRIAWAAALLFLVVLTVLILEMTGVIPY